MIPQFKVTANKTNLSLVDNWTQKKEKEVNEAVWKISTAMEPVDIQDSTFRK